MGKESPDKYIEAFERGLLQANKLTPNKKAVGLLSLDRTLHTLEDAQHFIECIQASPHNLLVGLDISGNPLAKRTLSGEQLGKVIDLVLNKGLAIAIHVGESDSEIERQDTDAVLSALEHWKSKQPLQDKNPLHGKIRLGHCIYLTQQQKERMNKLGIPIEVCPTCHSKLNWHLEKTPHPVTGIYSDLSDPVVIGTDDELIFGASVKFEFNRFLSFFSNTKSLTRTELKIHQSNFRFSL
jgi:adenosine deaminase